MIKTLCLPMSLVLTGLLGAPQLAPADNNDDNGSNPVIVSATDDYTTTHDHAAFRRSLREILNGEEDLQVVAESENGASALRQIELFAPSLALVDMRMAEMTGLEVAKAVRSKRLPTKTIILTMYKDEELLTAALKEGVRGYVLKDDAILEIVACIRAVEQGKVYVSKLVNSPKLRHMLNRELE